MKINLITFFLISTLTVSLIGCAQMEIEGNKNIFTYDFWTNLYVILLVILSIGSGWILKKNLVRNYGILLYLIPLFCLMFLPFSLSERVVLDADSISVRRGPWGWPKVTSISLEDLEYVRFYSQRHSDENGILLDYMKFHYKTGTVEVISLNHNLLRAAEPVILETLSKKGVMILDEIDRSK